MNIFFRTDASIDIGTGHVIRCLTLSDELRQNGVNIGFICREETGNLIEYIEKRGYYVHRLPADIDIETDIQLTQRILERHAMKPDWLVIDHYDIDSSWESPLREFVRKIMVIDDLANRQHDCDLLLDQNCRLNGNNYNGLVPDNCMKLLGPKYALLRPQFLKARENLRERTSEVKRILVFMGGTDTTNETSKALRAIQMLNRPDIAIDTIIGASNPYRIEIIDLASQMPNTNCYFQVDNMAELMALADLCIGAGGTTTWERCCLGLPTIVIVIAENQIEIAENLAKKETVINLGWFEHIKKSDIEDALKILINNHEKSRTMSTKARELVDGRGAERVANALIKERVFV